MGKTMLARYLVRYLLPQEAAVVCFDSKGDLHYGLREDCAALGLDERTILLETNSANLTAWNPLKPIGLDPQNQAAWVAAAFLSAWRQHTFFETAQMWRWLYYTMALCIDGGGTIVDGLNVLRSGGNFERNQMLARCNLQEVKREWRDYEGKSDTKKFEITAPAFARLQPFCENPVIEAMMTAPNSLDLGDILREGKILLAHIPSSDPLLPGVAQMLRSLLFHLLIAQARNIKDRPPLYLVIDEAWEVMEHDPELLEEILNLGSSPNVRIHVILIFHTFAQAAKVNPGLLSGLLSFCRTKILGGGIPDEDLQVLTPEFFRQEWNPYIVKDRELKLIQESIETTRVQESESKGGSKQRGTSLHEMVVRTLMRGKTKSSGTNTMDMGGMTLLEDGTSQYSGGGFGTMSSEGEHAGEADAQGTGKGTHTANGENWNKGRMVIPFQEIKKHWYYLNRYLELNEYLATRTNQLKTQVARHFVIKYFQDKAVFFRSPDVFPLPGAGRIQEFLDHAGWEYRCHKKDVIPKALLDDDNYGSIEKPRRRK
jgi:hypothetical protein